MHGCLLHWSETEPHYNNGLSLAGGLIRSCKAELINVGGMHFQGSYTSQFRMGRVVLPPSLYDAVILVITIII